MDEPGVPLPGANVPPETVRFATLPVPVNRPPLTIALPFSAPLLTVVPAVLVRRPDTVAPVLLLKIFAFETVPVQVRLLLIVPALETTLPVQTPLLVIAPVLLATLATYVPPFVVTPALLRSSFTVPPAVTVMVPVALLVMPPVVASSVAPLATVNAPLLVSSPCSV